jgi:hypothetical protein
VNYVAYTFYLNNRLFDRNISGLNRLILRALVFDSRFISEALRFSYPQLFGSNRFSLESIIKLLLPSPVRT